MEKGRGYALVTGASKGIGKAIAYDLAGRGWPLLLVARSEALLQQLQSEIATQHQVPVQIYPTDLAQPDAPAQIAAHCQQQGIRVQILVNNAGFGVWEAFDKASLAEQEAMNALNVSAVVRLCHVFIPLLRQNSEAWIMNVSSLGAYQPLPNMALYGAGKAYVRSFSYAIRRELQGGPISVTCLSPGGVISEFADRAGSNQVVERNKNVTMTAEKCARIALNAMFRRRTESIPGWYNRLGALLTRFLPTTLTAKMAGNIMRKN